MNSEKRTKRLPMIVTFALLLAACGGGGGGGSGGGVSERSQPAATAVGEPVGGASTAIIGADGGSVVSADGKLTLTVPAGALTADTEITIQSLTNHAHGGVGGAYRLSPDGQTFAAPVRLALPYTDADLAGSSADALGLAFQRADGLWEWAGTPELDPIEKTVTVETSHFSDWSLVHGFQIRPASASVATGSSLALNVRYCYPAAVEDELLTPLGHRCEDEDLLAPLVPGASVSEWSVNGVSGGSGTNGTVSGHDLTATYVAPASLPDPANVAVSARLNRGAKGESLLVANITLVSNADYAGTVTFETTQAKGTASLKWNKFEDLGDTRRYLPDGTMTADLFLSNCDPAYNVKIPLEASSPASPGPTLVVYTAANNAFNKRLQFVLQGAWNTNLNLMCGSPREPTSYPARNISVIVGGCPAKEFPSYTDEKHLTGSFDCAAVGLTSASWDFKAPN